MYRCLESFSTMRCRVAKSSGVGEDSLGEASFTCHVTSHEILRLFRDRGVPGRSHGHIRQDASKDLLISLHDVGSR